MTYRSFSLLLLCFLIISCSRDALESNDPHQNNFAWTIQNSFQKEVYALSSPSNDRKLLRLKANGSYSESLKLGKDFKLPQSGIHTSQDAQYLNLTLWQQAPAFWQVDMNTGNLHSKIPFCDLSTGDQLLRATSSGQYHAAMISRGEYTAEGLDTSILLYDQQSGNCGEIALGRGDFWQLEIYGDTMIIHENGSEEYLVFVNLNKAAVYGELLMTQDFISATVIQDSLFLFKRGQYEVRDLQNFSILSSQPTEFPASSYQRTLFKPTYFEDRVVVEIGYPQPATVGRGPGIYDLGLNDYTAGLNLFMFDVRKKLEENLAPIPIGLTSYMVDPKTNLVYVGVILDLGKETQRGGVLLSNFNAEMLYFAEIPFAPHELFLVP